MEIVHRCRLPREIEPDSFVRRLCGNVYYVASQGSQHDRYIYDADEDVHYYAPDVRPRGSLYAHFRCAHLGDKTVRFDSYRTGEITMTQRNDGYPLTFNALPAMPFDHHQKEIWFAASAAIDPYLHLYNYDGEILRVVINRKK